MGQRLTTIFQREPEHVQEVDITNSNAYKWPPKTGNYFGSHFIMGGERFESQQPEAFLFGENTDLNFLGCRPVPFPYPSPQLNEPTRTLRSLVNIRKDTIRLVRCELPDKLDIPDGAGGDATPTPVKDVEAAAVDEVIDTSLYNVEFTFDSDVSCNITVMYFAKEEMANGVVVYTPQDDSMNSETFTYKRGANQAFSQSTHFIEPCKYTDDQWTFDFDKEEIPIVIHCTVEKEPDHVGHSHATFCALEKTNDGYTIKAIKQKQCVDGLLYMLQEFYGIENKENETAKGSDDDLEDNTAECVICMCNIRDTLILPCRHLCLCNECADSLRYQANNCPICRAPFRALLQLRAIRKKVSKPEHDSNNASEDEDDLPVDQKGVPQGYEAISLIEALNGPSFYNSKSADPRQRITSSQGSLRRSKKKKKDNKGSKITSKDKDKDKEIIVDEEKEREANKIGGNENDTDRNTEVTTKNKEKSGDDEQQVGDDQSTEGEGAVQERRRSSSKDSITNSKKEHSDDTTQDIPTNEDQSDKRSDSGSSNDDPLTLSSRTQTTTLPGTPDHVIDDAQDSP